MDYLDFLPDTPYAALPTQVKASITEADYEARRQIAIGLDGIEHDHVAALPGSLLAAYRNQKTSVDYPVAKKPLAAIRKLSVAQAGWGYRLAVAASLFFAATTLTLLLWQTKEKIIYQLVSAPVPAPVLLADTIYVDKEVERVVYRDRVDTVDRYLPSQAHYVYVTDTVYLPESDSFPLPNRSKTAAEDARLLELLVPTE